MNNKRTAIKHHLLNNMNHPLNKNSKSIVYQEPETWTLISALDRVLEQAKDSELKDELWKTCENPINFLMEQLKLTKIQIVFLAILIEAGEPMSWRKFGNYLNCSRLSIMIYSEELEELVQKRWLIHKGAREMSGYFEGFALVRGVISALRHNKVFIPEKIDGLTAQELIDKLESRIDKNLIDGSLEFKYDEEWMVYLCKANEHLNLCREIISLNDIHAQSLLLMIIFDYAQWADSENEGLTLDSINDLYPDDCECNGLRRRLKNGSHILIKRNLIEYKCEDGIANTERFMLTDKAKSELLSEYKPSRSKVITPRKDNRYLKNFTAIKEKDLFFNQSEQEQIDRINSLLSQEKLTDIQQRLEKQGLRKGFACLFYGDPGTGKTETALQIARKTGRNIMQIDIAGIRNKWVGESEKNIKGVFAQYKELCKNSEVMPILFFNEADGIINKRTENTSSSVDKMNNAIQNIILQEIEDLEGILIATTNLTSNLDPAFDRRFLFKIKFNKPNLDVKAKIWGSMLKGISDDDAHKLASEFDFSGGQIENVARKYTIDYILNGTYADINGIKNYCKAEFLEDKNKHRAIVGYCM